jgi:hypothetical protein
VVEQFMKDGLSLINSTCIAIRDTDVTESARNGARLSLVTDYS